MPSRDDIEATDMCDLYPVTVRHGVCSRCDGSLYDHRGPRGGCTCPRCETCGELPVDDELFVVDGATGRQLEVCGECLVNCEQWEPEIEDESATADA